MTNLNEKLFEAVEQNKIDEVLELIERGADIGARNEWGSTPLELASKELKRLIKKKKFQNFINKIKKIFS